MQPILAEPVPHRRRAVIVAVALTLVATLAAVAPSRGHDRRFHHRAHLPRGGTCPYGYVVR